MPFLIRTFHPEHGHEYAYSEHDLSDRLAKGWIVKEKNSQQIQEVIYKDVEVLQEQKDKAPLKNSVSAEKTVITKKRGRPKLNGDN